MSKPMTFILDVINPKRHLKIIEDWQDSMMWCPSQCELKFKWKNRYFIIYLRWRHNDPWTAQLIECPNEGFDMHTKFEWVYLGINDFGQESNLNDLKRDAIKEAVYILISDPDPVFRNY